MLLLYAFRQQSSSSSDISTQRVASDTIVSKRQDGWRRHLVWKYRPPRRPHCIRRVPIAPRKGPRTPSPLGPCLLWPRSPISATAELLYCLYWETIKEENELSSCWDGRPFGHNSHGLKSGGGCCTYPLSMVGGRLWYSCICAEKVR